MRFRPFLLIALALGLLCCSAVVAQAQGHTIRGKVRNAAGTNVAHATVTIEQNGAMVGQTVANGEGDFNFSGLMETSYTLVVTAPDYNPASESVEFVRTTNGNEMGETRTVEITLLGVGGVRPPRAGLTFVQDVPAAARDAYQAGIKASREKRTVDAMAGYEKAIQIFPDYFDAHFVLANELARQDKFDQAFPHLDAARRINPKDDRVWELFGRIMAQQRKYAVAARVYAEAAELNPLEPMYLVAQASALIDQAALIDPNKSEGAARDRESLLSAAEQALVKAEKVGGKKLAEVHRQRARLYEKKGDRARAANELELYLRNSPNAKNAAAIREAIKTLRSTP